MMITEHASPLASLGGVDSGGQNVYVDKLSYELGKIGFMVDIYTRWDNSNLPEVVDIYKNVRVVHIKAGPKISLEKENILPFMDEFKDNTLAFIDKHCLTYDIIHANFFMSGLVALNIKKERGIPYVITFHALGKIRKIHQKEMDKFPVVRFEIEEKVAENADQVIAECPQDMKDLIKHYNTDRNKISIIPCGYDPEEMYPINKISAKTYLGLNIDKNYILQLGRMVPRKGVDNVILALSDLVKRTSLRPYLLIVGGESDNPDPEKTPEIARLMELVKKENILDHVIFTGRKDRDQLRCYYSASEVFVSTPWYEPFGITPLEAMACGTPVIGSKVGGIKFTVIDGKTGYLVPSKKPKVLSEKLEKLLTDPRLAESMQINAIKRVNKYFKWSIVAELMSDLYKKLKTRSNPMTESYHNI